MKATIKFASSQKPNSQGYPVYKILRASGIKPLKATMFRSQVIHWNSKANEITKQHPDFDLLIADLLNIKSLMASINLGLLTYEDANMKLFGITKHKSTKFFDACLQFFDGSSNGNLYKTVLNSFNEVYFAIEFLDIKPQHAKDYMMAILKHQRPNGVHTYMRTLDALFKKISDSPSPFKGVRPRLEDTASKDLTNEDLRRIFTTRTLKNKFDGRNTSKTVNYYRYYYMLMFYLGGIDAVDLAKLRYDEHVFDGRIQFKRSKGGTSAIVNNKIFPQAYELLAYFNCYPYLVPLYLYKKHKDFVSNMNDRLCVTLSDLNLSRKPLSKSARYSFINRAQELLIDERITAELVGHKRKTTTSIYTKNFPLLVRDEAHDKIINLPS
jgi:integrase